MNRSKVPGEKQHNKLRQRNPKTKFLVRNLFSCFRRKISLKGQSHLLLSVIVYDFPTLTDVIVIELLSSLSFNENRSINPIKRLKKKTSYLLPLAFMEGTIRHNIAQVPSASKAYIPCLHAIIIKRCHMIT